MSWRFPELLWLLLLVPLFAGVLLFAWYARQRASRAFASPELLAGLVRGRSGPWRATRSVLFLVGLALTIVALAGPQYGSRTRILRKRGVDVVIALDFSKSMLAQDVRPSRIQRAKAEVMRLVRELEGDRVGIVAFAGDTMEFPMTTDYAALSLFFRDLGPGDMPVGGTAIGRALTSSQRLLDRASAGNAAGNEAAHASRSRVVVLMTDGEDHEGDPVAAARELAADGIKVLAVGIGSLSGEPIPTYSTDGTWTGYMRDEQGNVVTTSLTPANEQVLRQVASITGGKYFRARAGDVGVEQIRAAMRGMKQEERKARRITVHEDRYVLALLPAFFLLLLESLLPEAWLASPRRRRSRKVAA